MGWGVGVWWVEGMKRERGKERKNRREEKRKKDIPRVHLGDDLKLVLDGRNLLGRSRLGSAEAEHFDFWSG